MTSVTVGIDIGTTSVKAIAADDDGTVVARARVPHALHIPTPTRMQHDANEVWRDGPQQALQALGSLDIAAVSVAAMVPSLTAVDANGRALLPGLLYGDDRGGSAMSGNPAESGELIRFAEWCTRERPDAAGLWPAPAVANHALMGDGVLDTMTAATASPLFDWNTGAWSETVASAHGLDVAKLPRIVPAGWKAGRMGGDGPIVAAGAVDAFAEQLVAGADNDGDVLVILGTTLIVWCVSDSFDAPPGWYSVPHSAPGKFLVGGPSNAGGLFCNWAQSLLADGPPPTDPERIPVWLPYPRGERAPYDDSTKRAALFGLDLLHSPGAARRAVWEASGFVARRTIEASGVAAQRIVATGGGTRVDEWVQALADCTGLPVDCVEVPEGGAYGSAFLARCAARLEDNMTDARRWARTGRRVEPRAVWARAAADRFSRFIAGSDGFA
ncbi:MAG: xylulokinase [Acidimicrobiia bacterium]